jgi:hypothetical protein
VPVGAGDGAAAGGATGAGAAPPLPLLLPLLVPVSEKSVVPLPDAPQLTSVMATEAMACCAAVLPLAACVSPSTEGVTEAELSAYRQRWTAACSTH